ncbi:MAG: guanylate kinase [Myxococcaceae bacterium]
MNTNPQVPQVLSPGLLLVLSAPSGAGKTTLARMLEQEFPGAEFSISYTTRAPRGAERNGQDYHFVDTLTFQQMIDRNEFVEWAEVHGNFYGSSKQVVAQSWRQGGIGVFDIDVQGGTSIKRKYPDSVTIFILPPSMTELERRLRARGTDADEVIRRRMLAARAESERGVQSYDYIVINDQLEVAFQQLRSIVIAERSRRGRVDTSAFKLQGA